MFPAGFASQLFPSPKQVAGPPSGQGSLGRVLSESDPQLYDIATELVFDTPHMKRFANCLLNGSGCKKSATVFLAGLDPHIFTTVPSKVHELLQYW